jgi:hypothetical protein
MEDFSPSTGQPYSYTYYNRSIRLYPVPSETVYEVRIGGHWQVVEPASDTEKYNPWMIEAEQLIRARAKLNLARNVNAAGLTPTFSDKALIIYRDEETDAFNELKMRTNKLLSSGKVKPYC